MPSLLSGSKFRTGGSGEFLKLADAMPQLPQSPSQTTGFTLVTNDKLQTFYSSSLGNIQFDQGQIYSNISTQTLTIIGTGTTAVVVRADNPVSSTSTFIVQGGASVFGDLYVAEAFKANTTTFLTVQVTGKDSSSNTTTGALVVAGGAGIGENVNIGGYIKVLGTSTFSQSVTVGGDTNISGELNVNGFGSVSLSPNAASVIITPTLGGSITIQPSVPGSIDAMEIGKNVPEDGYFTTIHANDATVTNTVWVGGSVYSQDGIADYNNLVYTPKVTISPTAPLNPRIGDFWIIPQYGVECQYVNDGGNLIWIQFTGF